MTKQQISQLVAVAVAGITAGLSGCGGASGAPAAATTSAPAADKHACKGEMGDKHGCGADMKGGMDDEKPKIDAPAEPAKSSPADANAH